jgi:hypothetical protein
MEGIKQEVVEVDSYADGSYQNSGPPLKKIKTEPQATGLEKVQPVNTVLEDEFDVVGKCMSYQLRNLNKTQLIISRKLISDIIYYASLEKLTESTCVVFNRE